MDRDTYIRNIYSKYYITAREHKYGFLAYDKNICNLIAGHVWESSTAGKRRLLEVAVGTGYPIADTLQKAGFEVHGVDISPLLVERCHELNPLIHAVVGDARCLQYPSNNFDAVYCIHSTWFLSSLRESITEMIRVVKKDGIVAFDILNRDNLYIAEVFRRHQWDIRGIGWIWRQAKNVVKVVTRHGYPQWRLVVHQIPSYPSEISAYLQGSGCKCDFVIYVSLPDGSIREVKHGEPLSDFGRLIYIVKKGAANI